MDVGLFAVRIYTIQIMAPNLKVLTLQGNVKKLQNSTGTSKEVSGLLLSIFTYVFALHIIGKKQFQLTDTCIKLMKVKFTYRSVTLGR